MMADPVISDKLYEMIFAFVDREAGFDAPLALEDEMMVRDLIESDLNVRRVADEERTLTRELMSFYDDTADIEVSAELVALIRDYKPKRDSRARSHIIRPANAIVH